MGIFAWFNEEKINLTDEMSAHDITRYVLIAVLILVLILYFVYHKCKKLNKTDLALKNEIAELREIIRNR